MAGLEETTITSEEKYASESSESQSEAEGQEEQQRDQIDPEEEVEQIFCLYCISISSYGAPGSSASAVKFQYSNFSLGLIHVLANTSARLHEGDRPSRLIAKVSGESIAKSLRHAHKSWIQTNTGTPEPETEQISRYI
jgi:hypothetical protein